MKTGGRSKAEVWAELKKEVAQRALKEIKDEQPTS